MVSKHLEHLVNGHNLAEAELYELMSQIMAGELTSAQVAALLIALRIKGESTEELKAAVRVMREKMTTIELDKPHMVDTCGTGGDKKNTFNISTCVAFVVAAAGGVVAKHGNRSNTSQSGSADVLQAAGANIELDKAQVQRCIETLNVGFLFAPQHHMAMKHVVPVRKELGIRTLFNLIGPMCNPAKVKHQLIGVFSLDYLDKLALVLHQLGSEHVLLVHAEDGLDEISIGGPTHIVELKNHHIAKYEVTPELFGLTRNDLSALEVSSPQESLAKINDVFANQNGPAKDIVLLNAGAAIYAADVVSSITEGVSVARNVIESGQAKSHFESFIKLTNEL